MRGDGGGEADARFGFSGERALGGFQSELGGLCQVFGGVIDYVGDFVGFWDGRSFEFLLGLDLV